MLAEFWNLRGGDGRGRLLRESGAGGAGIGNEDPNEGVALLARIAAGIDAVDFQSLLGNKRRDPLALAGVSVEPPAVVGAFDLLAVEVSAGKRHAAMRAGIAQSESFALPVASNDERLFEQRGLGELSGAKLTSRNSAIPEAEQHQRIGRLGLDWRVVGHRTGEHTAAARKSETPEPVKTRARQREREAGLNCQEPGCETKETDEKQKFGHGGRQSTAGKPEPSNPSKQIEPTGAFRIAAVFLAGRKRCGQCRVVRCG